MELERVAGRGPVSERAARRKILGIDPGTSKCGYAVVFDDGERAGMGIVATADVAERIEQEVRSGGVAAICIGDATTSRSMVGLCRARWPQLTVAVVDERNTTFEARRRYFAEHPPRGILRFIPKGMLVPPEPLDAYAALLIVERYLRAQTNGRERV